MEYMVASFRSRAHTVSFHSFLAQNGIPSEIINTPKEAGVGCGLSVKFSPSLLPLVKKGVKITDLSSFAGFFQVKILSGRRLVRSI